jgi:hypothetical protein
MKKLFLATVLVAAAACPTTAFAGTFTGVVVGKGAGTLAVAANGGLVRAIHTRAHVRLGARVHVDGTRVRLFGIAHRARIHGVVVRRVRGTTFLAAGRSLLAVRSRPGRRLAAVAPTTGAIVNANVAIAGGRLTQQSMQVVGHDNDDEVTIQAPVTAVGPGTVTVTVNGQPLTIRLPAGIQLPASLVGQTVTLTVELEVEDENEAEHEDNDDNDDHHNRGPGGDDDGDHSGPGHGGGDDD